MNWLAAIWRAIVAPLVALWGEAKGLRTEEVRSVAVVSGIVIFALVGQMMAFGLAWQATRGKLQWGEAMISLGRDPDPDDRVTYSDTDPAQAAPRGNVPDDPDGGKAP